MQRGIQVLLVEDDVQLGRSLVAALRKEGYPVEWATTLSEADRTARSSPFDLILLDLGLPDGSGQQLLKTLRWRKDPSLVMVLSARSTLEDKISTLDEGADDFLPKPFAIPELFSRMRALLRRAAGFSSQVWTVGGLEINAELRSVKAEGQVVVLTAMEYDLLEALASRAGRVVQRERLESLLVGDTKGNALEVRIHHLRHKVGSERIRTVRGVGYMLEAT